MADTPGLGGLNSVYVTLETDYGTYVDPADGTGAWVPILTENLAYTEEKYYSPQIREQTIVSSVTPAPYHVAGDIEMEVDPTFLPYFLYASRHAIDKSGLGPYVYVATPSSFGASYPGGSALGLSISVVRNGVGFGYAGCVVGQWAFTIDNGILKVTMSILGLSEEDPADLDTSSWVAPVIFGADASSVYLDAAGTAPTFSGSEDISFNGFTATFNYNAEAQNRITSSRKATFVKYGETEATFETELDFLTKTQYNDMKSSTTTALRLESLIGGADLASASAASRIDFNNASYDTYEVDTPGMGDLVMARVTGRGVGIAGGDAYSITCKSPSNVGS